MGNGWEHRHHFHCVSSSGHWWTSGTFWTAIAALATLAAVATSLFIAERARSSAEQGVKAQLAATESARRREHSVELLLRILDPLSLIAERGGRAGIVREQSLIRSILAALEPGEVSLPITQAIANYRYGSYPPDLEEQVESAMDEVGRAIDKAGRNG